MGVVFFLWLFPGEVGIIEGRLGELGFVIAFYIVGKVMFEKFVALEEVADDWDFVFNYVFESFWSIFK